MKSCHISYFVQPSQKIKIRNAFASNTLTDTKFSKGKLSKIMQLGWFLASISEKVSAAFAAVSTVSVINGTLQIKMYGQEVVRAGKGVTLSLQMNI